ncbi:MAG TPA: cupin domain-containing protein [Stellaceae bacterium]
MRLAIIGTALLLALARPAMAQNAPGAPGVQAHTLAASKVAELGRAPLYVCALSVTIPAAAASHIAGTANGIFYQLSGSTEIGIGAASKTVTAGEALFIPAGNQEVSLKAVGDGPSRALQFLLVADSSPGSPIATEPAHVDEMFRSPGPVPDLKAGAYQMTLTRRTFPPGTPPSPPRHHSGAALLYVLSGTGTHTVDSKSTDEGPGSLIYEPSSLVYRWGNRGGEPWTYLAFTLSPEGMPPTVAASSPK